MVHFWGNDYTAIDSFPAKPPIFYPCFQSLKDYKLIFTNVREKKDAYTGKVQDWDFRLGTEIFDAGVRQQHNGKRFAQESWDRVLSFAKRYNKTTEQIDEIRDVESEEKEGKTEGIPSLAWLPHFTIPHSQVSIEHRMTPVGRPRLTRYEIVQDGPTGTRYQLPARYDTKQLREVYRRLYGFTDYAENSAEGAQGVDEPVAYTADIASVPTILDSGCLAWVRLWEAKKGMPMAVLGVLVGYNLYSRLYRIYIPEKQKVEEHRNVRFDHTARGYTASVQSHLWNNDAVTEQQQPQVFNDPLTKKVSKRHGLTVKFCSLWMAKKLSKRKRSQILRIRFVPPTESDVKQKPKAPRDIEGNISNSNVVEARKKEVQGLYDAKCLQCATWPDAERDQGEGNSFPPKLTYDTNSLPWIVLLRTDDMLAFCMKEQQYALLIGRLKEAQFRFTDKGDVSVFCGVQFQSTNCIKMLASHLKVEDGYGIMKPKEFTLLMEFEKLSDILRVLYVK
eukprot:g26523.t1